MSANPLARSAGMLAAVVLICAAVGPDSPGQDTPKKGLDRMKLAEAEELDDEAQDLYLAGRYAEAAKKLDQAWTKADEAYGGDPGASTAHYMMRAANMHMVLGNADKAERLTRDARDKHWRPIRKMMAGMRERKGEAMAVEMEVDCGLYLGVLLLEKGRYAEGERELTATLKTRGEFPPDEKNPEGQRQVAMIRLYLGVVRHRAGDMANARREMEAAIKLLDVANGGKVTHETVGAGVQYANVLHELLEYQEAKTLLLGCLKQCRAVFPRDRYKNGHVYIVKCLSQLGLTCAALGEFDAADKYLLDAKEMQEGLSPTPWDNTLADIANKRGLLAQIQGRTAVAEKHYAESLKIRTRLHPRTAHPDLADARHNMGGILVFGKRFKDAAPELDEAAKLWRTLYPAAAHPDGHPLLAKTLLLRSLAAAGSGDRKDARTHAAAALAMYQRQAELIAATSSEAEALNFATELTLFRSTYLSVCSVRDNPPEYDTLWAGKSLVLRVLADRQRVLAEASRADDKVRKLVLKWQDTRDRLAGLTLAPAALADPERASQLTALTRQKEDLERELNATPARRLLTPAAPALKDLVGRLPEQAAFVDIYQYDRLSPAAVKNSIVPSYMAFVVRRDTKPAVVDLGAAEGIDRAVAKWVGQILADHREDAAEEVYRLVWKPLTPHLPTGKGATVYLAPDGELARLPWAALPVPKVGTVLLQEHRLALVPSGPFLADRLAPAARRFAAKPGDGTFLLVADVDYSAKPDLPQPASFVRPSAVMRGEKDGQFKDLKGTAVEADWIKPLVPGLPGSPRLVERRKEKACVAKLLTDLPDSQVAHVATHGLYASIGPQARERFFRPEDLALAPNGMRLGVAARNPLTHTAVVLAGANLKPGAGVGPCMLSGETIAGLDLRRLRLCTLPDCHTAKGEEVVGEGVYGLQRAFHQAGVDDVVAGLWAVSDEKTPPVMLLYYHNLAAGSPPIDALRDAQLFLLRNPDAVRSLAKKHAPADVAKLVADRPRGDDPDFVPRPTAPRPKAAPGGMQPAPAATRDWAVFVLSGLGE